MCVTSGDWSSSADGPVTLVRSHARRQQWFASRRACSTLCSMVAARRHVRDVFARGAVGGRTPERGESSMG